MKSFNQQLVHADERVDLFMGGQVQLIQSQHYFTASVDAVLLAHFIKLPNRAPFKYIDFCTGNGIIPLLLSQRTDVPLTGIELQDGLVDMAQRSAVLNHVEDRLTFLQGDVRDWKALSPGNYDMISCNPPYFLVENSNAIHHQDNKAWARHEITLTMSDWVNAARRLLRERGRLYIVHRPERLDDLMECLLDNRFSVNRLCFIYPKPGKMANGVLLECIYRGGRHGVRVEPPIIVHQDNNDYTDQMKMVYQYG